MSLGLKGLKGGRQNSVIALQQIRHTQMVANQYPCNTEINLLNPLTRKSTSKLAILPSFRATRQKGCGIIGV